MREKMKEHLLRFGLTRSLWSGYRSRQLHREYARRRDHYASEAAKRGLIYAESEVAGLVEERLRRRGYSVRRRKEGEIHTFASVPTFAWHEHLIPDLRELGPLTHFDYTRDGISVEDFVSSRPDALGEQRKIHERLLASLDRAHKERPVDWAFFYGGAPEVTPSLMRTIEERYGIPTVNMSLDDKQGFEGEQVGECRAGVVDITRFFDLYVTSARVCCEWHLVEGGRPVYLPEGFNASCYRPMAVEQDIDVSFIGVAYGFRVEVVQYLRSHGIDVKAFGPGWGTTSVWGDEQIRVINRSRINLGMGGIGYSESLTNVKTRDFEIPGAGGGVYLTTFNPDLASHFEVGKEILCYHTRDEMLELIRFYLARPDEAAEIARGGRARCLSEHRWLYRYQSILRVLGILEESVR
jgi:spore maturation protein CgeB